MNQISSINKRSVKSHEIRWGWWRVDHYTTPLLATLYQTNIKQTSAVITNQQASNIHQEEVMFSHTCPNIAPPMPYCRHNRIWSRQWELLKYTNCWKCRQFLCRSKIWWEEDWLNDWLTGRLMDQSGHASYSCVSTRYGKHAPPLCIIVNHH